jgi:hypothetical protein
MGCCGGGSGIDAGWLTGEPGFLALTGDWMGTSHPLALAGGWGCLLFFCCNWTACGFGLIDDKSPFDGTPDSLRETL